MAQSGLSEPPIWLHCPKARQSAARILCSCPRMISTKLTPSVDLRIIIYANNTLVWSSLDPKSLKSQWCMLIAQGISMLVPSTCTDKVSHAFAFFGSNNDDRCAGFLPQLSRVFEPYLISKLTRCRGSDIEISLLPTLASLAFPSSPSQGILRL